MSAEDLLVAIIVGGIGLSGAHFRAEYLLWRKHKAAEQRYKASLGRNVSGRRASEEGEGDGAKLPRDGGIQHPAVGR